MLSENTICTGTLLAKGNIIVVYAKQLAWEGKSIATIHGNGKISNQ